MFARKDYYLRIGLLLVLALVLWRVVRTRQAAMAQAQHTEATSTQPMIDRTAAIYRDLYPEAATVNVVINGRSDTQWLLQCQDSPTASPAHFIWDVATGELVSCGGLRLPRSDRAALTADLAISDQALRTERMARRWLVHLGFSVAGRTDPLVYLAKQWPQSRVRFVSYASATRQVLMGVDNATGDLVTFYSHRRLSTHQPAQPTK